MIPFRARVTGSYSPSDGTLQRAPLAKVAEAADIASQRGQRCARSYLPAILTAGLAAGQKTILEIPGWKGERLPGVIVAWDTKSLRAMFQNAVLAVFMSLRAASQGDSGPGVVYVRH